MLKRKHSYHETTVRRLLTSSFWYPPQRTRRPPRWCRLSKFSYTLWRTAFNCAHRLSFRYRGIQVFSSRMTDTCLYNDYIYNHMTQRFHTSRWKISHLSFCKQVFSTWTYYKSTFSATCYDCVNGRGLFQKRGNFKNAQKCYAISNFRSAVSKLRKFANSMEHKYVHTKQNVTELETHIRTFPDLFCLSQKLEIQFQECLSTYLESIKLALALHGAFTRSLR